MVILTAWKRRLGGGTLWGLPVLGLLGLLCPGPSGPALIVAVLLLVLVDTIVPVLAVPEANKAARMASQGKWAQANFYNILAQHKVRRSPWKGGIRLLRTAYQPSRLETALRGQSGRILLGLGQLRDAERVLRQAVAEFANDAPSHHNLAVALAAQGKLRQAKEALRRAVELGFIQPATELTWKGALARLPFCRPQLSKQAARVTFYQKLGFHRIALDCLSLDRGPAACWPRVNSLLALGRRDEALRETRALLETSPEHSQGWLCAGFLSALDGHHQQALDSYRRALRQDSQNLACKEQLNLLLLRTSSSRGLGDALSVLQEYEENPHHLAFGKAFFLAGLGQSLAALQEVVASGPAARSLSLWEVTAYASLELGQPQPAFRLLRRFCTFAEVSGLPMLDREQRLRKANQTLTALRGRRSRQDSTRS